MIKDDLTIFVDGISKYFKTTSQQDAVVGTPFLTKNSNGYFSDYTGMIEILGDYKGSVFFTAPDRMLMKILRELGLVSTQKNKLLDLAGEISNTLTGNARKKFGENFKIRPPKTFYAEHKIAPTSALETIFIIPIEWNNLTANLIIDLQAEKKLAA